MKALSYSWHYAVKTFLCVDGGQYSPGCGDGGDNITTEDYIFTEIKSRQITGHQGTLGTRLVFALWTEFKYWGHNEWCHNNYKCGPCSCWLTDDWWLMTDHVDVNRNWLLPQAGCGSCPLTSVTLSILCSAQYLYWKLETWQFHPMFSWVYIDVWKYWDWHSWCCWPPGGVPCGAVVTPPPAGTSQNSGTLNWFSHLVH